MLNLQFHTGNEHKFPVIIIPPLVTFMAVQSGYYTASITVIIVYYKYFSHILVMYGYKCKHVMTDNYCNYKV